MRSLSILLLDKNTQGVNGHGLVGGLLPNANLTNNGFLDKGILSTIESVSANNNGEKQFCLIKNSFDLSEADESARICCILYVYHGGETCMYCISALAKKYNIKSMTGYTLNNIEFYKNTNNDLIIKAKNTSTFTLRLQMYENRTDFGVDLSKCMVSNSDIDLTHISVSV